MIAYFDCFSGISGDMVLGAFIDLGVPVDWLKENLRNLPFSNFDLKVESVSRMGIQAASVHVLYEEEKSHRHFPEIRSLVENSPLPAKVRETGVNIFERIAKAEAAIHGCSVEAVHFHEVGSVDSIVDIVGAALCVEFLGPTRIVSSKIPLGRGFVECRHGTIPVPSPATVSILKDIPVYGTDVPQELTTPTGAAIVAELADAFETIPDMRIEKIGYGAGKREIESRPNMLRILAGSPSEDHPSDRIVVIETGIDDMNPELFGFLMERLFDKGALDVCWIPVFMKKNRPGILVQVLCEEERRDALANLILAETTTLGVRYHSAERRLLKREKVEISTPYGIVGAKRVQGPGGESRIIPEYEICRKIALDKNLPIRVVYETIAKAASQKRMNE